VPEGNLFMNYSEKIEQLEKIMKDMESSALSLEKTLALYDEGQKLIRECREYLTQAEGKISRLEEDGTLSDFGGTSTPDNPDAPENQEMNSNGL